MKKLINLIALVMLVSTNVLTPFSYANAEISGENPENAVEKAGETSSLTENQDEGGLGENLPLIGDDENGNEPEQLKEENNGTADSLSDVHDEEPDETEEHNEDEESNEIEENDESDEENEEPDEESDETGETSEIEVQEENMEEEVEEDITLQKADESVVMEVISGTSGTLLPGQEFNQTIKRLAGQSSATFSTNNTEIKQIIQWTGDILPSGITTGVISTTDSQQPIYAWYTGGIIYYVSNAEKIYMNPNSSYMFYNMQGLTGLDIGNWDTSNVTNMSYMFYDCRNLTNLDISNWNTSNVTNMSYMFSHCRNLTGLDLNSFDAKNVTNMSSMFQSCSSLTGLDLSSFDTSNVTNMSSMFQSCSSLTGLDLSSFDTSNVTNMQAMFLDCSKLEYLNLSGWDFRNVGNVTFGSNLIPYGTRPIKRLDMTNTKFSGSMDGTFVTLNKLEEIKLDGIDTSNVTSMRSLFEGCSLTGLDLSSFDTSNVTDMRYMFRNCSNLGKLDLSSFDTSNVTNMSQMFNGCGNLEEINLSGWDFRNVGNVTFKSTLMPNVIADSIKRLDMTNTKFSGSMDGTFSALSRLEEIKLDGIDTSNVTSMRSLFEGCSSLIGLNLSSFDTSNVTNMGQMFEECNNLTELNLNNWDTSKVTDMRSMFYYCKNLTKLNLSNWDLSNVTSIYNIFNGCSKLENLNLEGWVLTGNVSSMFGGLSSLKEINLDGVNTKGVTNMSQMFQSCSSLTGLDLSSFDTSNVTNMNGMFNGCSKLEKLNLDGWDFRKSGVGGQLLSYTSSLKFLSMSGCKIPQSFTNVMGRAWGNPSTIEEIDVSNWDLSLTSDIIGLFGDMKALKTIKGLDTWNTSGITNMSNMFGGCSNLTELDLSSRNTSNVTFMPAIFQNCSGLVELDLSNWDTSNVTQMGQMFAGCSGLVELDLSNWDTSNVTQMGQMFAGCNSLENLNLDNWTILNSVGTIQIMFLGASNLKNVSMKNRTIPESFVHAIGCRNSLLCASDLESIDVSNWNLSQTKDISGLFGDLKAKEIKGLDTWDTSGITNMNSMFQGCSSLTGLDLSSFDTSNVTNMGQMFFNTPNLTTIYASDKFVTTALSGDNSSKDMFSGTTSVIGGNGTKFDPNYIDKTYALIDKVGQTGYFTDKNSITVKFINTLDGTETISTFKKGQKITPPYVEKYHVAGGYLDEAMTQEINLNNGVDSYTEIYVKYERNGSSGGGGGGGSSKPDTPKDEQKSDETSQQTSQDDKNTENVIQSETEGSEESSNTPMDSSFDKSASEGQIYIQEFQEAYKFARQNGITTMPTIQKAQMNSKLTRIQMAKMLSQYAINVLGKAPDTTKKTRFKDVTNKMDKQYDNGVTLAYQLGIMGQNMKNNRFRPNDEVTRAEFATALSRLIYSTSDGEYKGTGKYYIHHMEKLVKEGIITNDNPNMKELRGYVMIMLMRSAQ